MASRKRSVRLFVSSRRKRRSILPLLENLENRLVLSVSQSTVPLASSSTVSQSTAPLALASNLPADAAAAWLSGGSGLVAFPLANGGTAWMLGAGSSGPLVNQGQGSSPGTSPSNSQANPATDGAILDHLPVASPLTSGVSLQTIGPSGYIPQQIQTAYGLSNGSVYNNNIAFGGIKGDGTGQTIGIYEEGYNPDFVDTYVNGDPSQGANAAYTTSAGVLRQDLRPHRPAQPDLLRQYRGPAHGQQQQLQQSRLRQLRRRRRDRAGHRVGARHGAWGQHRSSSVPHRNRTTTTRISLKGWTPSPASPGSRWSR